MFFIFATIKGSFRIHKISLDLGTGSDVVLAAACVEAGAARVRGAPGSRHRARWPALGRGQLFTPVLPPLYGSKSCEFTFFTLRGVRLAAQVYAVEAVPETASAARASVRGAGRTGPHILLPSLRAGRDVERRLFAASHSGTM